MKINKAKIHREADERNVIQDNAAEIDSIDGEYCFDVFIQAFKNIKKELETNYGYSDLLIQYDAVNHRYIVRGKRLETPEEVAARIKKETAAANRKKKSIADKEAKELATYEQLKKKFEKQVS